LTSNAKRVVKSKKTSSSKTSRTIESTPAPSAEQNKDDSLVPRPESSLSPPVDIILPRLRSNEFWFGGGILRQDDGKLYTLTNDGRFYRLSITNDGFRLENH
jgi:hypothetical protein